MRIAEIHIYQKDLSLSGTYRMSEGAYSSLDSTIVEVVSDTGVSGWGKPARSARPISRNTPWVLVRL